MPDRTLRVGINGTGFAGEYTARTYGMIPHQNGVTIELAGVVSGRLENAQRFAETHSVTRAYDSHAAMLEAARPDIDNICCANFAHGPYTTSGRTFEPREMPDPSTFGTVFQRS